MDTLYRVILRNDQGRMVRVQRMWAPDADTACAWVHLRAGEHTDGVILAYAACLFLGVDNRGRDWQTGHILTKGAHHAHPQ